MAVIIQCAGSKVPCAGSLETLTGRPVKFVARPDCAPSNERAIYARPDDPSDILGRSWRDRLVTDNTTANNNPLGLLEAYKLYRHPVYEELIGAMGTVNVFILSAGWGLVRGDYLLPVYDITFASSAECYKRRRPLDKYNDFRHLIGDVSGPIVFFGSWAYLPLFQQLADHLSLDKVVFYASLHLPRHPGWRVIRFKTSKRTNWHYDCAHDFLKGKITI